MANKLIAEMGLPKSIVNVFTARNILTAKEALSLTEFDLMELLDVSLTEVSSAVAHISAVVSPPYQTARLLMEQRANREGFAGRIPTQLKGLDDALCGGIPFGVLTELVGPAGIGKTQFCLKMALLVALPARFGGLDGRVIYIDLESKFSSRRLIEIGATSLPEIFHMKGMAQEMGGRIMVLQPASFVEFTESLQQIKVSILQNQVRLLVVDSMAALVSGEQSESARRQHSLAWHISFIKSLAEFARIPVLVTNQVRCQLHDGPCQYGFQAKQTAGGQNGDGNYDSHLVAALGIHWAHAVTIRLVLEDISGQRYIKIAKSPISPPLSFPFSIASSGIMLLDDSGTEIGGQDINKIHHQGHGNIINFDNSTRQWAP